MGPASELKRRRRHLIQRYAPLFHLHVINDLEFDRWLSGLVALHLRSHPSRRRLCRTMPVEEEARLAVAMVVSAVHYLVRGAIERDEDVSLSETDIELTIDAMAQIHRKEP
jgi:hypothetical protein